MAPTFGCCLPMKTPKLRAQILVDMFSGAVKLAELDDFLTPSNKCIVAEPSPDTSSKDTNTPRGVIMIENSTEIGHFNQIVGSSSASITLADCLACSGCVTSAETVLIEQQSSDSLMKALKEHPGYTRIVSISSQTIASLAVNWDMSFLEAYHRVVTFLSAPEFAVEDIICLEDWPLRIALHEAYLEFIEHHGSGDGPVLSGECPGWVCYAEKTQHHILPYISRVKSPQQIAAALTRSLNLGDVYHFSIMPCFDKKLEASRDTDVDLVLSSVELERLIPHHFKSGDLPPPGVLGDELSGISWLTTGMGVPVMHNAGSGGYLEYIFRNAAMTLYEVDLTDKPLDYKTSKRNPDFQEVTLEVNGEVCLRFARAYGFRNIQNLIRKLKRSSIKYDYVEVMACPSGCVNGGGQLPPVKANPSVSERKEHLAQAQSEMKSGRVILTNSTAPPLPDYNQVFFYSTFKAVSSSEIQDLAF